MSFLQGLFGAPSTPPPPNPIVTGAAATSTNVGTAVANAMLNQYNQTTPTGSLNYSQRGTFQWTDPVSNVTYSIPQFTTSQTLTPDQQQILDSQEQAQINMGKTAVTSSGQLGQLLGNQFDPSQGNFDAQAYLNAYPDVAAAYASGALPGESQAAFAARHYQQSGQFEGRMAGSPGGFNATAYLNAYPDVAQAAANSGMNPQVFAQLHYQQWGQYEGRTAGGQITPSMGNPSLLANQPQASLFLNPTGQQQGTLADVGQQQRTFGDAGDITRSYGPADSFSADRQRVEEALYQRMDPQLQRDKAQLEARLADQGIRYGDPAYQAAMDQFQRGLTDTRLGITQTAGQEQQRMMDMAAQQAGFQNAAQQQAYQQALGRGTFANTAQQQAFAQALQGGQFANAAQAQNFAQETARQNFYNTAALQRQAQAKDVFAAQNATRNQYLQEQYAQRNQPINEITSLLSGSQVQNPNFVNTPNSQIPTTDIAGIINNRFTQDMSVYNAQNQQFNQLMGGIFGGLGGLAASDRRIKENIEPMGSVLAANDEGEAKKLPIYQYSYKADPASVRHIGPMAQDVEKIDKSAVKTRKGIKYIDTTRLGSIIGKVA